MEIETCDRCGKPTKSDVLYWNDEAFCGECVAYLEYQAEAQWEYLKEQELT